MTFSTVPQPSLLQSPLGPATVDVLGPQGLRLHGLTSFHLDEGPDFIWLNIYRTLANGRQLEVTRDRRPEYVGATDGQAVVRWPAGDAVDGALSASYRVIEEQMAVDATFTAHMKTAYANLELFIANYFTPYYSPQYAIQDNRTHPEGIFWYTKQWYGSDECESWARDPAAEAVFADGRWQSGFPLNWRRGPLYAYPLMIQQHRYGHAIVLMARPEDCFGLSGFNSYHNAQYFHLGGHDIAAGQTLTATVRLVLLTEWEDLPAEALARYRAWISQA